MKKKLDALSEEWYIKNLGIPLKASTQWYSDYF